MKTLKTLNKLATLGLILALTACGSESVTKNSHKNTSEVIKIGIGQFAEHGSLDNCREGFIQGLAESGFREGENLEIIYENAGADIGTATQIADNFIAKNVNLICAITTPMAQVSYNEAKKTDIPVVYTAITNPVAAELADKDGNSTGNITGTSDRLPIEEQLKMIKKIMPDVKKIGILYCTSEVNSEMSIKEYKERAKELGVEIVEQAVTSQADIPLALDNILTKVDCLNNITDNTVVNSLDIMLDKARKAGKPVFGSEIEQVKKGCVASMGLDYIALGKETGKMAAKVLRGEKANSMKFKIFNDSKLYGNEKAAKEFNLSLPEGFEEVGR